MKVIGTDYSRWVEQSYETIKKRIIERDVRFAFLLPDPAPTHDPKCPSNLERTITSELIDKGSITAIETALTRFRDLRDGLDEKHREKIQIKLFDLPLTHGMAIAIPKAPEKAEAHIWPYLHKVRGDQRPYIIYENGKLEHRVMFEKCLESYRYVLEKSWEEGKEPEAVEISKLLTYTREQLIAELPFDRLLARAKQEIVFVAASLEHVATKTDLLTRLIRQNNDLTVTCVLLNPENKQLIEVLEKKGWAGLKNACESSLKRLCALKTRLGGEERKRLRIMTYDVEPPFTMVILDPRTNNGHMELGSYISGIDPSSRIMNVFTKKGMKELFEKYWDEYKAFCESKAKEHTCLSQTA